MRRGLDAGLAVVWACVLAAAAWVGHARLPALWTPPPGAADERVHTVIALVAWPLALAGWLAFVRPRTVPVAAARPWADLRRQLAKSAPAVFGLYAGGFLALVAVLAPLLAPYDWQLLDVGPARQAPSLAHPFGTDDFGRDLYTRCLYGARISLVVGFLAVGISATLGTLVGAVAGYVGGWVDRLLMGLVDLLLSLPRLVLLMAVLGLFRLAGPARLFFIVAVLGATGWMGVARIVRAQVLSLAQQDFVAAARSLGLPPARILLRHVVPNAMAPVIVYASLALGGTILTEASLSFLGLGVPPPTPTWGVIVNEGKEMMRSAPWVTVFPGLLVCLAVMSFNLLGDGLRDALDPRLRGRSG
jgi:peptide/nickel transport system permease protein